MSREDSGWGQRCRTACSMAAAALLTFGAVAYGSSGTPRAAAEEGLSVDILSVDDSEFPDISVIFTADRGGRPVASMAPAEVSVQEGGVGATVTSLERATDAAVPLALVVVIDVSGSMVESDAIGQAKRAARSLVSSLSPGDAVAVVSFADTVKLEQPLTTNRTLAVTAIDRLEAIGNTALYDAVAQAAALADGSNFSRRAVILLSDGAEFGARSTNSRSTALDAAAASGAVYYVIGVGPAVDQLFLDELALRTRGTFVSAAVAQDLEGVYRNLEEVLRSHYVLRIRSAAGEGSGPRSLTITVSQGDSRGSASSAYQSARPEAAPTAPATPPPSVPESAPAIAGPPTASTGYTPLLVALTLLTTVGLLASATWAIVARRRRKDGEKRETEVIRESFLRRARNLRDPKRPGHQ
jgi:tight adherence protein B